MDWDRCWVKLLPESARAPSALRVFGVFAALALALALGLQLGLGVVDLAVVAVHLHRRAVLGLAEVGRVLKEALLSALQGDDHLGDRGVGDGFKAGAEAAFYRVDATDELDFDRLGGRPFEGGDDVGQLMA